MHIICKSKECREGEEGGGWSSKRSNKTYLRLFHPLVHHRHLLGQLLLVLLLQGLGQEQAVPAGLLGNEGDGLSSGHFAFTLLQGRVEEEAGQDVVVVQLLRGRGGGGAMILPGLGACGRRHGV